MEGLLSKAKCQFFADFYQKNRSQGKCYTYQHFAKMGYMKTTIYRVMRHVDAGESLAQREGEGRPRKLSISLERNIKNAINNKKNALIVTLASEGPYATFKKIV